MATGSSQASGGFAGPFEALGSATGCPAQTELASASSAGGSTASSKEAGSTDLREWEPNSATVARRCFKEAFYSEVRRLGWKTASSRPQCG